MIILENKWCCVASIPQRNQLREVCSINIMLRFSSAFLYRPSERIYNEASWDQATSLEFKAFQFLCNNKNNLLSQLSGRFLDIPRHGMQHLKILLEQTVTKWRAYLSDKCHRKRIYSSPMRMVNKMPGHKPLTKSGFATNSFHSGGNFCSTWYGLIVTGQDKLAIMFSLCD